MLTAFGSTGMDAPRFAVKEEGPVMHQRARARRPRPSHRSGIGALIAVERRDTLATWVRHGDTRSRRGSPTTCCSTSSYPRNAAARRSGDHSWRADWLPPRASCP